MVQTDPAVPKTHLSASLKNGSSGAEVTTVQQRLNDLGFDPGPVDGQFGGTTRQAVWAFEKLILQTPRAQATGVVTDEMWQTMQDDLTISPLRPTGVGTTHVEVYVPQQVMAVFTDDSPMLIAHISTGDQNADGTPAHWCETATYDTDAQGNPLPEPVRKQECADAKTPGGVFKINRFASGNHVSPLGGMFNPVYFNYGIAIHGARQRAPGAGVARLRADQQHPLVDVPQPGAQGRSGVRVGAGRQAARAVLEERVAAVVQPAGPERLDHHLSTTTTLAPTTTAPASTTTTKVASTTTVPKTTTTTVPKTTTTKPPVTTVAPTTEAPTTVATAPPAANPPVP